jgi:hypothetical protein
MNIKIGTQYRLTSDSCNIVLQELIISKDKLKVGKQTWGNNKYYQTIEQALKAVSKFEMRKSEATDIKSLQADLVRCERMIEGIARELSE